MFSNVHYSRLANDTEIKHKCITKKIATTVGIVQNYVEYSRIQGKNYNCSRIPNTFKHLQVKHLGLFSSPLSQTVNGSFHPGTFLKMQLR